MGKRLRLHPGDEKPVNVWGVPFFVVALFISGAAAQTTRQAAASPPQQPLPFSHKVHCGNLELRCKGCHPNPDPGEMMRIVSPSKCMTCHAAVKANSPAMQKLAAFAKESRDIRWVRVYEIPPYVYFSHRAHAESGSTCAECHGQVTERDQLYREGDITMGGCMNCHREKKASLDCSYCHEPR